MDVDVDVDVDEDVDVDVSVYVYVCVCVYVCVAEAYFDRTRDLRGRSGVLYRSRIDSVNNSGVLDESVNSSGILECANRDAIPSYGRSQSFAGRGTSTVTPVQPRRDSALNGTTDHGDGSMLFANSELGPMEDGEWGTISTPYVPPGAKYQLPVFATESPASGSCCDGTRVVL